HGTDVKIIDTVGRGDEVSHVVFTPDGKRALATKFPAHKVALLEVNGDKVTYNKVDWAAGLWPYNVAVAPSGKIALTADNGGAGSSPPPLHTVTLIPPPPSPPPATHNVLA